MATTDAIKDKKDIARLENALEIKGQIYADIWKVGINMGLRITDLVNLKFDDIQYGKIELNEGKTKKARTVKINTVAQEVIERRRLENPEDVYIFQTKSLNTKVKEATPINRSTVGKMFSAVAQTIPTLKGLKIGTHTLRKTRGYAMFNGGVPVSIISEFFNHSSEAVTRKYIGITKQDIQQTYDDFVL